MNIVSSNVYKEIVDDHHGKTPIPANLDVPFSSKSFQLAQGIKQGIRGRHDSSSFEH